MVSFYNRINGANKNPCGGKKATIPWNKIDPFIIESYSSNTPPRSQLKCYELVEKYISENKALFLVPGMAENEIRTSPSAIKQRIQRLTKLGKLNGH